MEVTELPEGRGPTSIEVRVLGGFTILRDDEVVPPAAFGGRLARTLLRILLVERGTVIPRDVLIEALWGDGPPADPAANLNVLVNRARRALGDPAVIIRGDGGYALANAPTITVDAESFSSLVAGGLRAAAQGQPAAALQELEGALRSWAEPLPEDVYRPWAEPYRQRLFREREAALATAAEAALALHDHRRATALAREAAAAQPLAEAAQLQLVRTLAAVDDTAGALAAFTEFTARLAEELGLDPSPEAEAIHLRLLRGEPLPRPLLRAAASTDTTGPAEFAFVGREATVAEALRVVTSVRGGTVIVLGDPGTGKSRVLDEVSRRAETAVLRARACLPERDRPWGLARDLLRGALELAPDVHQHLPPRLMEALGDIIPEVAEAAPEAHEGETRRALAIEAGLRLLERVSARGVLLVCDDVQWADPSSIALLAVVRSRLQGLGMILACRQAESASTPQVTRFLGDLEHSMGTTQLELAPLPADAIAELIEGPEVVDLLSEGTDGSPMAIAEALRSLAREGHARPLGAGRWRVGGPGFREAVRATVETGQRRSIGLRIASRTTTQRQVLALLSLLARPASTSLIADAAGVDERETLDVLHALGVVGLAQVAPRGWTVAHDLIGETLVDRLAPTERARLHGLLAGALERGCADGAEVGRHRAGAGDADAAAAAYARAAGERLARSATQEAAELAEAGLAVAGRSSARVSLLSSRAEVRSRRGDLSGASDDLREALGSATAGPDRARILARMTLLATADEDLVRARELADTALIQAGGDPAARARSLSAAAIVDMNTGATDHADRRTAEAEQLYEDLSDAHGVADATDTRAMSVFLQGRITEALATFDRAARRFEDSGDLIRMVTPRSTRGHGLVFAGDPGAGLLDTEVALELALELGHPEGETYARWHRSEALAALGRTDDAIACAEQAVAIARRINHRGWTATALRALGISQRAAGDLTGAGRSFADSLAAGQGVELFTSWARTQLALVRIAQGVVDEAAVLVERALTEGPPLAGFEARLARAELAASRGDADAAVLAEEARRLAQRAGHLASVPRLTELAGSGREMAPPLSDR